MDVTCGPGHSYVMMGKNTFKFWLFMILENNDIYHWGDKSNGKLGINPD